MKSPCAYDYLEKIPMEQWCNMQWITTCKLPLQHCLPSWYGVVTSNMSECINSMIDDYRSEGWTDLLQKMAEKISENRQRYKMVDSDDVVNKVKQVLKDCFHSATAMQVVELEVGQKYMVTETYGSILNINLNQQWTQPITQMEHQQGHMPIPPAPARVKTNVLTIQEKTCSCGRWQEYIPLQACCGLLQETGRDVIPGYSPTTCT